MAQLSQEARIERAKLIFGQAPRDLQFGKQIKNKDIILAVELNLCKVSGRDSIKNAILLVTEKLIDRSVVANKKHSVKQKVDRLYQRYLKECKRYSVDSRTQKFRVALLALLVHMPRANPRMGHLFNHIQQLKA